MQSNHRKTVTLLLGGARSGKSHYAQQLAERAARVVFVATAQPGDDEMRRKIDEHRHSRPKHWQTIEEPLALTKAIAQHGPGCDLMIIDCLTFFAANLLDAKGDEAVAKFDGSSDNDLVGVGGSGDPQKLAGGVSESVDEGEINVAAGAPHPAKHSVEAVVLHHQHDNVVDRHGFLRRRQEAERSLGG